MALILGGLFALLSEANSGSESIATPQRCVGKLIVWTVMAGSTEQQVRRIFGDPECTMGETLGPIGTYHSTTTLAYLRYGVWVDFYSDSPPTDSPPRGMEYDRVVGGIG